MAGDLQPEYIKQSTSAVFLYHHERTLGLQPILISFFRVRLQGLYLTSGNKDRAVLFGSSVADISV